MSDLQSAHQTVCGLVDQFELYEARYLSPNYQEDELRKDFLDKFFIALGWDVNHDTQTNPFAQEVTIERRVKTGAAKRRADYAFALAPRFKKTIFFVEAKKPGGRLDTPDNYFQAIRYSWNTQLPLVVLSDFANFHVIDSRYRPTIASALSRQHKAYHYTQYRDPDLFAEIYWLFSREAVASNSLQNYANDLPTLASSDLPAHQLGLFAGGYQSIDDLFLIQLDQYRETLARAFKRDNPSMDGEQLTEVVQRTLDRLVFLRFLEDKLIEPELIVQKLGHAKNPWGDFVQHSKRLDGIYNGIVFKPHPQMDQASFLQQQQEFVQICEELSDAHSPYDFNHIPVEILGRIYERFLGKVVTATAKRVSVEEKPEVRKAGGVFYTPDYIVQYMAEQALVPLLQKKKPSDIFKTRIIDTSCGSGSFLIGVYEVLLQHVSQLYFNDPTLAAKSGEWIEREGKWSLSLKRKRELLVQCIYGVDIDAQAVQVAQLSLFLKLMEDETTASAALVQQEIETTLLPNLSRNIIVGNSLLSRLDDTGTEDFFASNQTLEQLAKLKAINLRTAFGDVMLREGGFDLVIGNPPYIKEPTNKAAFDHLRGSPYYQGKMDIWYMFACRALDLLKDNTGRLAMIATNNWVTNAGAKALRNKILKDAKIEQLIDFGDYKVFKDAGIQTMILIANRATAPHQYSFDLRKLTLKKTSLVQAQALLLKAPQGDVPAVQGQIRLAAKIDRQAMLDKPFTFASIDNDAVLDKIASKANFIFTEKEVGVGIDVHQDYVSERLHTKLFAKFGYAHGIFNLSNDEKRDLVLSKAEQKLIKPFFTTHQLQKYFGKSFNCDWVIYTDSKYKDKHSLDKYPKLKAHLDQFQSVITSDNKPYGLHRARNENFFQGEKIICLRKCKEPTFTYTDFDCYVSQTFNIIKTNRINQKYLTALLNSKLVKYWLKHKGKMQGRMFQVDKEPLLRIPLCTTDSATQAKIVVLIDKVLQLIPLVKSATLETQRDSYQHLLEDADASLQRLIYAVYGLNTDDIRQIESDT